MSKTSGPETLDEELRRRTAEYPRMPLRIWLVQLGRLSDLQCAECVRIVEGWRLGSTILDSPAGPSTATRSSGAEPSEPPPDGAPPPAATWTSVRQAADLPRPPAPSPPSADAAPSPIGRIGKYQLLEEVGRGGMGVVYRALDAELRREVALKTLRTTEATNLNFLTGPWRGKVKIQHVFQCTCHGVAWIRGGARVDLSSSWGKALSFPVPSQRRALAQPKL